MSESKLTKEVVCQKKNVFSFAMGFLVVFNMIAISIGSIVLAVAAANAVPTDRSVSDDLYNQQHNVPTLDEGVPCPEVGNICPLNDWCNQSEGAQSWWPNLSTDKADNFDGVFRILTPIEESFYKDLTGGELSVWPGEGQNHPYFNIHSHHR